MHMKKPKILLSISLFIAIGLVFSFASPLMAQDDYTIAMVVKTMGNPFFEACKEGGKQAAEELGDNFIFQGPENPTAEGQISLINSLVNRQVDAILISANDRSAVVPALERAKRRGVKVVSFDSSVAPDGRDLHLSQAQTSEIGRIQVELMGEMVDYSGKIAILSSTSTATNQNAWIKWMKKELEKPKYDDMELVTTVYGKDLRATSYQKTLGLLKSYPDLAGIISPTTVGIAAAARALEDQGKAGEVELTGLGLPSEMVSYVNNGTSDSFALWNPIHLGYVATYMADGLLSGDISAEVGETFEAGERGEKKIIEGPNGGKVVILGRPFVFDKDNIDKYADVF